MLKKNEELAPGIFIYKNIIDNPQRFIEISLLLNNWQDPRVASDNGPVVNKEYRDCKSMQIETSLKNPLEWFELAQVMWKYGNDYSQKHFAPFSNMEVLQMIRYFPNKSFYRPHADSGPGKPRLISSILYLNDVEEGGETYFDKFNLSVKPEAGKLLMFPSDFVYTHEAKPPISNEKFIVVTWFTPILGDINE